MNVDLIGNGQTDGKKRSDQIRSDQIRESSRERVQERERRKEREREKERGRTISSELPDSSRSTVSSFSLMLCGSIEISLEDEEEGEGEEEGSASEIISSSCISAMLLSIEAKVSETLGSQTSISTGSGVDGAVSILYRLIDCTKQGGSRGLITFVASERLKEIAKTRKRDRETFLSVEYNDSARRRMRQKRIK